MSFKLIDLPFSKESLSPFMSVETIEYHYGKHHQAYVDNLNKLVEGTPFATRTLQEVILESVKREGMAPLFNNAAQNYNHIEFWNSLKLNSNPKIPSNIENQIKKDFGSFEDFKAEFLKKGAEVFGSGWVWLVSSNGKLKINKYSNAMNPVAEGEKEILGVDVWEHSYYIDYRNKRADYLKAWFENLINWEYVEAKTKNAL